MKKKVTPEMLRLVFTEMGKLGGEARAKKYDKATLKKWAKLGGRPRKDAKPGKSAKKARKGKRQ